MIKQRSDSQVGEQTPLNTAILTVGLAFALACITSAAFGEAEPAATICAYAMVSLAVIWLAIYFAGRIAELIRRSHDVG